MPKGKKDVLQALPPLEEKKVIFEFPKELKVDNQERWWKFWIPQLISMIALLISLIALIFVICDDSQEKIIELETNQTLLQKEIKELGKNQTDIMGDLAAISNLSNEQQRILTLYNEWDKILRRQKDYVNCSDDCCITFETYEENNRLHSSAFKAINSGNYERARKQLEKMDGTVCPYPTSCETEAKPDKTEHGELLTPIIWSVFLIIVVTSIILFFLIKKKKRV